MHAVDAVVQQAQGLVHVVGRAHGRAGVSTRLLHEAQDVRRRDDLSANPAQTPGGERAGGMVMIRWGPYSTNVMIIIKLIRLIRKVKQLREGIFSINHRFCCVYS